MQEKRKVQFKDNYLLQTFSYNLRRLRKQNNFTQQKVSEATNLDLRLYQKYESSNPPDIGLSNLCKILHFYNIGLDELLK